MTTAEPLQPTCPVDPIAYKYFLPKSQDDNASVSIENQLPSSCPVSHAAPPAPAGATVASACPVPHASSKPSKEPETLSNTPMDPRNNMPSVPEQKLAFRQRTLLSTHREMSTIPMAVNSEAPASYSSAASCTSGSLIESQKDIKPSGESKDPVWVYPSEQMFFNAMQRKSWKPREEDMKVVVPIHNAVNERCWQEILQWERLHDAKCGGPKLVKFEGRPTDYTPKARLWNLFGYTLPFDRHDWVVNRCGHEVKYIIDFYSGKPDPRNPDAPSFYLDVRPALSFEGIRDRAKKAWTDWWQ